MINEYGNGPSGITPSSSPVTTCLTASAHHGGHTDTRPTLLRRAPSLSVDEHERRIEHLETLWRQTNHTLRLMERATTHNVPLPASPAAKHVGPGSDASTSIVELTRRMDTLQQAQAGINRRLDEMMGSGSQGGARAALVGSVATLGTELTNCRQEFHDFRDAVSQGMRCLLGESSNHAEVLQVHEPPAAPERPTAKRTKREHARRPDPCFVAFLAWLAQDTARANSIFETFPGPDGQSYRGFRAGRLSNLIATWKQSDAANPQAALAAATYKTGREARAQICLVFGAEIAIVGRLDRHGKPVANIWNFPGVSDFPSYLSRKVAGCSSATPTHASASQDVEIDELGTAREGEAQARAAEEQEHDKRN